MSHMSYPAANAPVPRATAVVGSRSFADYALLCETLRPLAISRIVTGGAIGADRLAMRYARENDIPCDVFYPDYERYGRGAPKRRNPTIIAHAEFVVAFWDGKSEGTRHALNIAKLARLETLEVPFKLAPTRPLPREKSLFRYMPPAGCHAVVVVAVAPDPSPPPAQQHDPRPPG